MLGLYVLLHVAADINVVLAERKLTTYVYAVGKQPSSNVWYRMVKDGIGELWMKGWNLLRRYFRALCLIMFIMFYATMFYSTLQMLIVFFYLRVVKKKFPLLLRSRCMYVTVTGLR